MQNAIAASEQKITRNSFQATSQDQPIIGATEITRNPFQATVQAQTIIAANSFAPLTHYSIHSLQMLGTLVINQQQWAIIATPDGITRVVTIGSQVGQEHAQVIKINNTSMSLRFNQMIGGITYRHILVLALPKKT